MAKMTANEIAKLFVEKKIDTLKFMVEEGIITGKFYRTNVMLSTKQGKWVTDVWMQENKGFNGNNPEASGQITVNGKTYNYSVEIAGYYKAGKANTAHYKMTLTYR